MRIEYHRSLIADTGRLAAFERALAKVIRKGETVVARCECVKLTKQVAFVRGVAHGGDPDRPIAHSAATFMTKP